MKKTFLLTDSNKPADRHIDSIKHEIKKYIARERKKTLPEGSHYWDFDCQFGNNESEVADIHISEINSKISEFVTEEKESFHLVLLSKAAIRPKK